MAKSKPKTGKRRIWRTLLYAVLGLLVFLLMFVSAFIFNPFEGSLPELRDVVPRGVNFFVRKQNLAADFDPFPEPKFWAAMADARGFDALAQGSIGQSLRQNGFDRAVVTAREEFARIAAESNGFLDIMGDVIGDEVIVAGYNQDYSVSPPRPLAEPMWCVYTRVNWRVKLLHGLAGFGFVQGMLEEQGMKMTTQDDLLVVTQPNGQVIYIKRDRDALMIANQTRLLEEAQMLLDGSRDVEPIGQQPAYTDGALKRIEEWSVRNDVDDPNVLEFVVEPNAYDGFRRFAASWPNAQNRDSMNERVLASFVNLNGWMQVTGGVMFEPGFLGATGQIGLNSKQHTAFQSSFYTAEKQRRDQWLDPFLNMVPETACAAAALRVPVGEFLHAMFDALEVDEKSLINDALRRSNFNGTRVNDAGDLIERLRIAFQPRAGFVFRRNEPDLSRDKETGELLVPVAAKSPMPQVAWVFWLRPGGARLVDALSKMLRDYYTSFGFRKVYYLSVPYAGGHFREKVSEFTNPQIPATGEIAMITFGEFFVVSNSGPLIKDILRTRYGAQSRMRSIRDLERFRAVEDELSPSLNGLVWVDGENLTPVIDDYLAFADASTAQPNPEWMMLTRPSAEDFVRRKHYPQYPSKASMPPNLIQQGGEFDQKVVAYMREKWTKERTNFSADDRQSLQQLRGL
ncbi:MAG: hypothetical protein KAI24_08285, partial [Planctomycetes bacterium]|nr:hypothetical protein [Planctomycetota bacterium]